MSEEIRDIVREYRNRVIEGKFINLVPFTLNDVANVVEIRNREKNRYFFNQTNDLNIEAQTKWYEAYLERDDDIYWCIYNKQNQFIGTVRVYKINKDADICDQGSFVIYEDHAEGAPYAIEAELLTLDFAFNVLKINSIVNEIRADNKVMNNLAKKLGFDFKKNTLINGVDYKYYVLNPRNYKKNRDKFQAVIDYWVSR